MALPKNVSRKLAQDILQEYYSLLYGDGVQICRAFIYSLPVFLIENQDTH